ncbi:MAG TPA: phosphate ABC transporter permease subunit PstC [Caulobacteraceae bacterium]|nr:phosphate ABC transporter permease subunit PstC [Caulobacteraceae bacterium]
MTAITPDQTAPTHRPPRVDLSDPIFRALCLSAATFLLIALGGVLATLVIGGWPAFRTFGVHFLFDTTWNPVTDQYGAATPIVGTLITSFLALAIALPLAIGVAVFLTEFCPKLIARPIAIAVELLAGIPSIVFGMWGLFVLAPAFAKYVQLPLVMAAQPRSLLETLTYGVPNGANIFTASLILAIMILPYMATVFRELFLTVPHQLRESAYGLGCTAFEAIAAVTIPCVRKGMVGVIMLGLGRALGETMAVTFIIGNSHAFPKSLFDSGSTIASTIANEFGEATGLHQAALIGIGLILFLITFMVLAIARSLLGQVRR